MSAVPIECPGCSGFRQIMARVQYHRLGCYEELRPCPMCEGNGRICGTCHGPLASVSPNMIGCLRRDHSWKEKP